MSFFEKIVNWVLTSSADPTKTSLTARSAMVWALGAGIKLLATTCLVGAWCINVDQGLAGQIIDLLTNFVYYLFSIIGIIGVIVGFARKLWLTLPL